ncbi:hypothetical protein ADEAN_001032100 [Angomonas deanei]|uniref:Uncharacterized protein n=1 Tax=Angomonas deanei TaxID=59799 RepID=A0A7G2CV13_9TRYP|nr:hypothetical protein ADEAN_001032100 [Angomonas deanei]
MRVALLQDRERERLESQRRAEEVMRTHLQALLRQEEASRENIVELQRERRSTIGMLRQQEEEELLAEEEEREKAEEALRQHHDLCQRLLDEEAIQRRALEEKEEEAFQRLAMEEEEHLADALDQEAQRLEEAEEAEEQTRQALEALQQQETAARRRLEEEEQKDLQAWMGFLEDELADLIEQEAASLEWQEALDALLRQEAQQRQEIEKTEDTQRGALEARERFARAVSQLYAEEAEDRESVEMSMEEELLGVIEGLEEDYYQSKDAEADRVKREKEEERQYRFRSKSESVTGSHVSRLIPGQKIEETESGKLKLVGDPAVALVEERMRERKRQEKIRQKKQQEQLQKQMEELERKHQALNDLQEEQRRVSESPRRSTATNSKPKTNKNVNRNVSPTPLEVVPLSEANPYKSNNTSSSNPVPPISGGPLSAFSFPAESSANSSNNNFPGGKPSPRRNKKKDNNTSGAFASPIPKRTPRDRVSTFAPQDDLSLDVAGKKIGTPSKSRSRASSLASVGVPNGGAVHISAAAALNTPTSARRPSDIRGRNMSLYSEEEDEL